MEEKERGGRFRLKLGASSCLLGQKVRYDGGQKQDRYLTDVLGQYVEFVPVCPEVEYGLPVPREAMRLAGDPLAPRLVEIRSGRDHTEGMTAWARRRVVELEGEDLCGFVFKSRSPSSGMERVRVYDAKGIPSNRGVGMFARIFMEHFPLLPVEDEGRLQDAGLRENFIERVFVMWRWKEMLAGRGDRGGLVDFHTRHKYLLMAHSPVHYRSLGKLVAGAAGLPMGELRAQYLKPLMEGLKLKATPAKNTNVLLHMLGYFKKQLSADEKRELIEVIGLYRQGHVPLIVPVTLVNHYVRKYGQPYLRGQVYLNPHPAELHLRNHA